MKFLLVIFCLLSTGCVSMSHKIGVDSYGDGSTIGEIVQVVSLTNPDSLETKEYVGHIERGLIAAGFRITQDPQVAKSLVVFDYSTSRETKIGSSPVFNYAPAKTYNYSAQTNYSSAYSGNTYSANTTGQLQESSGTIEYAGERTYSYDEYYNTLNVQCFSAKDLADFRKKYAIHKEGKGQEPKFPLQQWMTKVSSVGSAADFRKTFPELVGAAFPYFGKSTNGLKIEPRWRINSRAEMIRTPAASEPEKVTTPAEKKTLF